MLCKMERGTEVLSFLNRYLLAFEYSVTCLFTANKNNIHAFRNA